jgi:hypothetical protein
MIAKIDQSFRMLQDAEIIAMIYSTVLIIVKLKLLGIEKELSTR